MSRPAFLPMGPALNKHSPSLEHFQRLSWEVPRGQMAEKMWKMQSASPKISSHHSGSWLLPHRKAHCYTDHGRHLPCKWTPFPLRAVWASTSHLLHHTDQAGHYRHPTESSIQSHNLSCSNAGDGEECGPGSHSAGLPEKELDPFDWNLSHVYACLTEFNNLSLCGYERWSRSSQPFAFGSALKNIRLIGLV